MTVKWWLSSVWMELVSSRLDRLLRDASDPLGCANAGGRRDCSNPETAAAARYDEHFFVTDRGEADGPRAGYGTASCG